MHELSLCQAIVDTVAKHADGPSGATRCDVRIGYLRQVVPDSLQFSWELITDGTELAGCEPVDRPRPRRDRLPALRRADDAATSPLLLCAAVHGDDVDVVAGEEFQIASIDVVEEVDLMGRFHRHADGTEHEHDHDHDEHDHDARAPRRRRPLAATPRPAPPGSPCSRTSSPRTTASPPPTGPTSPPPALWSVNVMSSPGRGQDDAAEAHARRSRRTGPHRRPRGRHRHEPRRRPARRARRRHRPGQHEQRVRR